MLLLTLMFLAAEPGLTVTVEEKKTFEVAALEALGLETHQWREKGTLHEVKGVPLDKVLAAAGWVDSAGDGGVSTKHDAWRKVVLARAADGYTAVFSGAELAPEIGPSRVLVVTTQDGKPLSGKLGRFRLVVLTDVLPSRSVFQLQSLHVQAPLPAGQEPGSRAPAR